MKSILLADLYKVKKPVQPKEEDFKPVEESAAEEPASAADAVPTDSVTAAEEYAAEAPKSTKRTKANRKNPKEQKQS